MEACKLAEIILGKPTLFGTSPGMKVKNGEIIAVSTEYSNAAILTSKLVIYWYFFRTLGKTFYAT